MKSMIKNKKKYGIVSLNIYQMDNNWGSILQSWALQKFLDNNYINSEIVRYKPKILKYNTARYPFFYNFPFHIKRAINYLYSDIYNSRNYIERDNKFKQFIKKNYKMTEKCDANTISKLDIDAFIVGSDIIWDEKYWGGLEPAYFCNLEGMKGKPNIAYAPSLSSVSNYSKRAEKELPLLLNNFQELSVREESNKYYFQRYTDKDVKHVLDPTLLLCDKDYEQLGIKRIISEQYILVYCVEQNERILRYAESISKSRNIQLVYIKCCSNKIVKVDGAINFDNAGIEEWLSLIKYSDLIITTSFHACIFSVIFRKEFYAIYSEFGKEKVKGLLDALEIKNYCSLNNEFNYEEGHIDYELAYKKLSEMKISSANFLLRALSNGKNN